MKLYERRLGGCENFVNEKSLYPSVGIILQIVMNIAILVLYGHTLVTAIIIPDIAIIIPKIKRFDDTFIQPINQSSFIKGVTEHKPTIHKIMYIVIKSICLYRTSV